MQATKAKPQKEYSMLAIDKELHKDVKAFCAAQGITMISLVESLLKVYMKNSRSKEGQT